MVSFFFSQAAEFPSKLASFSISPLVTFFFCRFRARDVLQGCVAVYFAACVDTLWRLVCFCACSVVL